MTTAVTKQPTVIPEQHRKNCDTLASTRHKDGNNKKVISENK